MKTRYRLIRRNIRGGIYYCVDTQTGKRTSLQTSNEAEAQQLIAIKNQAARQPAMNLQIAQVYLQHGDPALVARTWQHVMEIIISTKSGNNLLRWQGAISDKALRPLLQRKLMETTAEHFLAVLKAGTVSTNVYLRRIHNYAVNMHWLPWPVLPKRHWPPIQYKEKRGITLEEHQKILAREHNPAKRAYYGLLWHLGGAQTDIALLTAEDIDWERKTIAYRRCKTGVVSLISFGAEAAEILRTLPTTGLLFPTLAAVTNGRRSTAFGCRLKTVGISGVSLHSYRYAWAERAKAAGYPERFAMQALGHSSKAVHRAYAKQAQVTLPPLEEYELPKRNVTTLSSVLTTDISRN